jgi:hypothetical protein
MRNFGFSYAYWLCLDMGECLARQIAQHITDPGSGIAKADEIPVVAAGAGEPGQIPEPESSDEGAESGA